MKTIAINIKTDPKVKNQAQKLAEELGLSLSAIVTASLKQFIRTREVQFSAHHRMTPYLENVIRQARDEYERGDYSGPFSTSEEMDRHLDSL